MRKRLLALGAAALSLLGLAVPATAEPLLGPTTIQNLGIMGRCVDIPGYGPGTIDGPVGQYGCNPSPDDNQLFYLDQRGTDTDGKALYWLRNAKDGLCLDLPYYGSVPPATKVTEYTCRDQDNQHWRMEYQGTWLHRDWFWIRNTASGLCLDIPGVHDAPVDVQLEVYPCRVNDDHDWNFGFITPR